MRKLPASFSGRCQHKECVYVIDSVGVCLRENTTGDDGLGTYQKDNSVCAKLVQRRKDWLCIHCRLGSSDWIQPYFVYSIPRILLTKENVYVIHHVEIAILPVLIGLLNLMINGRFGDSCRLPVWMRCGQEAVEVLVGAPKVATCA